MSRLAVLASRFVVGSAFGVREVLMTLVGGFTHQGNRSQALVTVQSTNTAALVLGLGLAAVATFWHMPAPKPFGGLQYKIPSYMKNIENSTSTFANESLFRVGDLHVQGLRMEGERLADTFSHFLEYSIADEADGKSGLTNSTIDNVLIDQPRLAWTFQCFIL
jgi:hypothetical protein